MEWESISARAGSLAMGREDYYLVVIDPDSPAVVLTRVRHGHLDKSYLTLFGFAHSAANAIRFPLGRGGGRPGGEPEMTALVAAAKAWAEKFEDAGGALSWRSGGNLAGPVPAGWELVCPACKRRGGGHDEDCSSVSIPRRIPAADADH
jgi:hypothetical protein